MYWVVWSLRERLQILFLNMESDIGAAAAFVFAHGEAIKGMEQMLHVVDDAYSCLEGDCSEAAEADKALVRQVIFLLPFLSTLSEAVSVDTIHQA